MDKATRNGIERLTQVARRLLEQEFRQQLEGEYDILLDGSVGEAPGDHLSEHQRDVVWNNLVSAVEHKRSGGRRPAEAVAAYLREAAFHTLNRFVALKMLEARELVKECVSKGPESGGFAEFTLLAPGLVTLPDRGYRLYIENIFDEVGQEVGSLFDRRDVATLLWPRRQALHELLDVLNDPELAGVWGEDETIGWVYQYFNGDDERSQMRAESQAPRNSRELAVRNQFFTPRYVVQFLTDNTLGRTWFEMTGGETELAHLDYLVFPSDEDGSCLQAIERPRKDPRDLRILDPACGSGHFLLYAFDLLLTIYREAWSAGLVLSEATGRSLLEDYQSEEALNQAIPKLIVEHNLHGVDIDPRAAQIAALALWLRAQRAYQDLAIASAVRPAIMRTGVVVAEPMLGNSALVEDFAETLRPRPLAQLFVPMVREMRLAGELGSLLKIEQSLATAVEETASAHRQGQLFAGRAESQEFWSTADDQIVDALNRFAESVAGRAGVERRLFAEDAAQGVAFIELLRQRFDVVLMNPPFGAGSLAAKKELDRSYPRTKNDIYAAFVERGIELLHPRGMLGAITSRTGFFLSSFQSWREEILLKEAPPVVFADLGHGVLDGAMVEVAAYCLERRRGGVKTVFLRALDADVEEKAAAVLEAVQNPAATPGTRFEVAPEDFAAVPKSPFAYWVSDNLRAVFRALAPFESEDRTVKQGLATADDFRFVRQWTEASVTSLGHRWLPIAKGGRFSAHYRDLNAVVDWGDDGYGLRNFVNPRTGKTYSRPQNTEYYSRAGLTWPLRGIRFSAQVVPAGAVFSIAGKMAFASLADLGWLSAVFNSLAFDGFIAFFAGKVGGVQYEVGLIQNVPVPAMSLDAKSSLDELARRAWSLKRDTDTSAEVSHALVLPALVRVGGADLSAGANEYLASVVTTLAELNRIQTKIDDICFTQYRITDADRRSIERGFGVDTESAQAPEDARPTGSRPLVAQLLSWSLGVAFGRFDLRLATGKCAEPPEPDPFDPLPVCSPGMLTGPDGLPLATPPHGYPVTFPVDGILVDDAGHGRDLAVAACRVFDIVFEDGNARWHEAAEMVGARGRDLRAWFARDFFPAHIKTYSRSRRKAPIYWQLATPSASYSVWLYIHRFTRNTLYLVLNDFALPKFEHEESKLAALVKEAGLERSASQRTEIDAQGSLVAELSTFKAEVARVAPLWNPDVNDGVIINFAPLWRLVPQNKAWQKECKKVWDALVNADYDWAHLAMHLWPERVVPKCQVDRSLAIAHGLEDEFWYEDDDGKKMAWKKRQVGAARVAELVKDRSSSDVKAALDDLLSAPAPAGAGRSTRRSRSGRKGATA